MAIKRKQTQDHFPAFIEYFIIFAILLVVVHTIVDDLARIYHWPHQRIVTLAVIGFCFDLFFSLEFTARSIVTARQSGFRHYFLHERGWVDFLSSFPLLLLVSGPAMLVYLNPDAVTEASTSFLHILKSAKAIRVTRILRLIRVLKIFGRIQNTDSTMTNRHVASIATISVVTIIVALITISVIPALKYHDTKGHLSDQQQSLSALVASGMSDEALIRTLSISPSYSDVIYVKKGDVHIYTSRDREELKWTSYFKEIDLGRGYVAQISHYKADAQEARYNMFALILILFLILSLMFIYTGMFAREVADPVFIMDKGLRHFDYNLEVKVNPHFADDEVFQLARAYNARWLPLKNQINDFRKKRDAEKSVLSVNDLF